jgi:hypothetical protein
MNRLPLQSVLEVAGWPGIAGTFALAAAALLSGLCAPRWQGEADAGTLALHRAAAQPAPPPLAAPTAALMLPEARQAPTRGTALQALARNVGVSLARVQEQGEVGAAPQLSTAGHAAYPALRQFVSAALAADPALVLDRVRLQRPDAGTAEVEFELQWTLLQRAGASAEAAAAP